MKKLSVNLLADVILDMQPLMENVEGKLRGGFAGISGLALTADSDTNCTNADCVNNGCVNKGCSGATGPNDNCKNNGCKNKDCTNNGCGTTTGAGTGTDTSSPGGDGLYGFGLLI